MKSRANSNDQLPDAIIAALDADPAFRVLTMDATGWIDPYTGSIIPTPFGYEPESRQHLAKTKPWLALKAKPLKELLYTRWRHYLREQFETVPFLRIFRQGQWLNPYTGQWVPGLQLEATGQVTVRVADDIARALSACPEAQDGKMLEKWQIETLAAQGPGHDSLAEIVVKHGAEMQNSAPAIAKPVPTAKPLVAKPIRAKTDFVELKQMFLKMLARPPRIEGFQMVVQYEPHSPISRDFYDFIPLTDGRLLAMVGDFTGQGPGAALMAATVVQTMRRLAPHTVQLVDLASALNDEVRLDLYHGSSISMNLALIDPGARTVELLNAGHHAALLISPRRDSTLMQLSTKGASLGSMTGKDFRNSLAPIHIQLEPADILILTTNGLFQTANPKDHDAGRLAVMGACVTNMKKSCGQLVSAVLDEVRKTAEGKLAEDMTMLAVRVKDSSWLLEADEKKLEQ